MVDHGDDEWGSDGERDGDDERSFDCAWSCAEGLKESGARGGEARLG